MPVKHGEDQLEFAADVPFVRRVLGSDAEAEQFTSTFGERLKSAKLPNARPQAAKGDALLSGYANTWVMDRDFEFVSKQAFDVTLPEYLRKNPIILLQHNHEWPLGQVYDADTDATGLAMDGYVRQPQDRDPDWKHGAFNDILAGILRTLSIGGYFYREIVDGEILVAQIDLFEISVVAVPANPDSIFEATQKAAKGLGMTNPAGSAKLLDMMQQLLGMSPVTDPALANMPERFKRAKYYELASTYTKEYDRTPPEYESWREVCVALEKEGADVKEISGAAQAVLEKFVPKQAMHLEGKTIVVGEKAGRTLSKANESKLRSASEKIQEVLDSLPEAGEQGADVVARKLADLKGAFGQIFNTYELQDALWDGFWALQQAVSNAMAIYDPDAEPDVAAVVEACNEFRDWLLAKVQELGGDTAVRAAMGEDARVLAAALGSRKTKDSERHCPECGTYMDNAEGSACPNCGHVPKAASEEVLIIDESALIGG